MPDNEREGYKNHYDSIKREFSKQAPRWAKAEISSILQSIVARLNLQPHYLALDVAAGTGLLARAISPYVKQVTALDITPAMIQSANLQGITNINFEQGVAEELPFPEGTFDLVGTRFSIHHFLRPRVVIREMCRVCGAKGRVLIIDLVSSENEHLARQYNALERLRDPSHTEALSLTALKRAVEDAGLRILDCYLLDVEMELEEWLETLGPSESAAREQIIEEINRELEGYGETGLRPFVRDNQVMFMHTLGIIVGQK
jgi:ubiquinone/menaquinone biosynthesis C-methylase UbiE